MTILGLCLGIAGIYYGFNGATSKNQETFKTQLSLQADTIKQNYKNIDEMISNLQDEVMKNQKKIQRLQNKIEKLKVNSLNSKKKDKGQ